MGRHRQADFSRSGDIRISFVFHPKSGCLFFLGLGRRHKGKRVILPEISKKNIQINGKMLILSFFAFPLMAMGKVRAKRFVRTRPWPQENIMPIRLRKADLHRLRTVMNRFISHRSHGMAPVISRKRRNMRSLSVSCWKQTKKGC